MGNLTFRTMWRAGVVALLLVLAAFQPPHQATVVRAQSRPDALDLTKTASPTTLGPAGGPVTYEVVFANDDDDDLTLELITDTLPSGFVFGGPAQGSDIGPPSDAQEPEIVWAGPFAVPADGTLTLRYVVSAPSVPGVYANAVEALSEEGVTGPVSATVRIAEYGVSVAKEAVPSQVPVGSAVDYTVDVQNTGSVTDTLQMVTDTLPSGFSFVTMLPGDVADDPDVNQNELTWDLSLDVGPGETVRLAYQVQTAGSGTQVNAVRARLALAGQSDPASASVYVSPLRVFLPLVSRAPALPPIYPLPWTDDFSNGISSEWQLFLNHRESPEKGSTPLTADLWAWSGELGVWGIYTYDGYTHLNDPYESWALAVFNGPGAEEWTDYRLEVQLKDVKSRGNLLSSLTGIWFRGTHTVQQDWGGGDVTGYYLHIKPRQDETYRSWVYLWRIKPNERKIYAGEIVASKEFPPGPVGIGRNTWYDLRVDVEGNRIRCFLKPSTETNYQLVLDWTDPNSTWMKGTVGLSAYATTARFGRVHVEPLD